MTHDSRPETYEHIHNVQSYIFYAIGDLLARSLKHDASKLVSPEVEIFDEFTPKLGECEFGSDEYKANLDVMGPALRHHYLNNDHHPQYHDQGVRGMSLLSVLEMLCDWLAATKRSPNGDIFRSIEINQEKYGFSDDVADLLRNTAKQFLAGETKIRYNSET